MGGWGACEVLPHKIGGRKSFSYAEWGGAKIVLG